MSSKIKVKSPYLQENRGDSVLIAQEFSHERAIREITLENTDSNAVSLIAATSSVSGTVSLGPYPYANTVTFAPKTTVHNPSMTMFVQNEGDQSSLTLSLTASDGNINVGLDGLTGMDLRPITFSKNSFVEKTSRNTDYAYNVDRNGEYIVNSYASPLQESKTSFGLLRTNPKLTGNVKITVDSNEHIWLNSIEALKELADNRFKKFPLSSSSNYVIDIHRFFDNGKTPPEIVYALYQQAGSYFSTQKSLAAQFDRFYTYGAEQLKSKFYDEDFSFFAPLRINEILPEFFVIFRANGPLNNFSYTEDFSDQKMSVNEEILKKADIVKVFDLSENSRLGKYIRNLQNHPARVKAEMSVSFQRDGYTTMNGISYSEASYAQKGELLSDYFSTPNTILNSEEFLTLGFQRNKLISGNILNLEYLFDDTDAEDYTVNRYFGLYLNQNEIATFLLSDKALEQNSLAIGQLPLPRKNVDGNKLSSRSFVQTNPDGIKLYVNTSTVERVNTSAEVFTTQVSEIGATALYFSGDWVNNPHFGTGDVLNFNKSGLTGSGTVVAIEQEKKRARITIDGYTSSNLPFALLNSAKVDFFTEDKEIARNLATFDNQLVQSSLRLFYLKDKKGNFYNVNSTKTVSTQVDSFTYETDVEIALNEKKIDVSNFTGVDQMLTQTEAELLLTTGNAVMEIEVMKDFNDFDYIEISMGATNSTEPTRWRIKAQTPYLLPGEVWPDPAILIDTDGSQYYQSLFYPGLTSDISQIAQTIVRAFNVFPYKIFDVTSDGAKVYFKSNVYGSSSNSMKMEINSYAGVVRVYGHENPSGISTVNFMGGSDKTKNRVKISREIAEGILDSEYFKSIGSYSKLRNFDVFGNNVRYFAYLEAPVKNDVDKVVDFEGKNEFAVIEMEKDTKFNLTQDSKTTSFSIHKSQFGVFSFFPLKDFDTDYQVSEYGKNYDAELLEFYQNIGAKTYSISPSQTVASEYDVEFSEAIGLTGDFSFIGVYNDGRKPRNYNGIAMLNFTGVTSSVASLTYYRGPSASLDINSGEISLSGANAPDRIVILPGDKLLYLEENFLAKFRGFFSLSSLVTEDDLKKFAFLESQWDFNRFLFTKISTEYDRLQENFLKEQALTSKVVPYIMKWISIDGKDVRDNPYRFNYSRAFGTMNFSPSVDYPEANSANHTHEWPYLGNVPMHVDPIKYSAFSFSYMFDKPDIAFYDFYSTKKDWFSEYFVTGYPAELYKVDDAYQKVPIETKEKYSVFKYDSVSQKTFTIFRGIRLEIGEKRSENGATLLGSEKYNDYRFSSVIVPVQEDDLSYHDRVEFDLIINEKFKFIVNIIKVQITGYRNPEGNISYVDLYTMENKRERGTYITDPNKVSPLGSTFSFVKGVPSDIIFPAPIYFRTPGPIVNTGEKNISFNTYLNTKGSLTRYIFPLATGSYSFPYLVGNLGGREKSMTFQNIISIYDAGVKLPYNFPPVSGSYYSKLDTVLGNVFDGMFVPDSSENWEKYRVYYASGGDSCYKFIRDSLSFYEIANALQNKSSKLRTIVRTISSSGTVTDTAKVLFNIVAPEKFLKETELFPVADEEKPSELYSHEMIGMNLEEQYNPQYIYRYQGNFTPKCKDVFLFGSREEESFAFQYNNDFMLGNTFIADVLENTFYLRNQYFSKVADEEILRINQSSGYKSQYPLVDEITIDHRDLFAWSSSWDKDYYRKYSTVSSFSLKNGTEEMQEIKSFLGSKMMKLPKEFSLYEFIMNGDNVELSSTEDDRLKVTLDINVYERFIRELLGDDTKAKKEFLRISQILPDAISPSDVESKSLEYVKKNIVNLFRVNKVNFYLLETGNDGALPGQEPRPLIEFTEAGSVKTSLSEKDLISKKYDLRKDVKVTLLPDLGVQIEFPLDSRYYTSLGIGVNITRI